MGLKLSKFRCICEARNQDSSSRFNSNETYMTYMSTHILPVAKTTTYGLKSTSYIAAKAGNALPDDLRSVAEFARFRKELRKLRNL